MEINPIELFGVIFNLAFVILMIYQKVLAWPFGILGSLVSIYLVYTQGLYSEAILYSYYVFMGVYGWAHWTGKKGVQIPILKWKAIDHIKLLSIATILALIQGFLFDVFSDANNPFVDAFTTIFSFAATYMQARKVLSSWVYWILINFVSVGLYFIRDLPIYSIQMVIFTILSISGWLRWKVDFETQESDK